MLCAAYAPRIVCRAVHYDLHTPCAPYSSLPWVKWGGRTCARRRNLSREAGTHRKVHSLLARLPCRPQVLNCSSKGQGDRWSECMETSSLAIKCYPTDTKCAKRKDESKGVSNAASTPPNLSHYFEPAGSHKKGTRSGIKRESASAVICSSLICTSFSRRHNTSQID
jgi:hypothetical protein